MYSHSGHSINRPTASLTHNGNSKEMNHKLHHHLTCFLKKIFQKNVLSFVISKVKLHWQIL